MGAEGRSWPRAGTNTSEVKPATRTDAVARTLRRDTPHISPRRRPAPAVRRAGQWNTAARWMTTSRAPRPAPEGTRDDATNARLEQENAQLRHAVGSHATVDQTIGVLTAIRQLTPAAGFDVLREVSQHTTPSCTRWLRW
ncbi:ANTAR domain-containing protein [Streptomyces coeruleorubidus]|uniref:ANTAR domain-containing protein n=1 Tax=Streptomyces coeruleorubidus TaxID=116188 RepID=A0ABZ0KQ12_STRC4|nr:ANTAR domain-containing protein [Streptomyces coeruleorubidus]WOT39637.1 ANTAR domain-containing protein [Streptomyces coeruleorubidus]